MFPKNWDSDKVINAISAVGQEVKMQTGLYIGKYESLDISVRKQDGKVISAFPVLVLKK